MRFVLGDIGDFSRIVFQISQNALDRLSPVFVFSPLRITIVAKSNAVPRLFFNRWIDTVRRIAVLRFCYPANLQSFCLGNAEAF